ncbi:type II toxin-antitoxin system RelE/ParE family toxin [Geoalkalibacter sp.]|uniref:type II toxin-antitoxin system RelE/ParE family toxin n=1 Tax=Geoalkalibacter sp. TaxID=3041440 RepID=UPI00272E69D1|nr:type II toxin-antitoxin system RelE/ParE family toxin [Geoalkalibacter sp.]
MMTIAETGEFSRHCKNLLNEGERNALIDYLAEHPEAGDLIEGTGGIRKLRWAREGRGKSGGVRVIYYFHSQRMPLYLLTVYGKNQKANLTANEKSALRGLVDLLKAANGL